MAEEYYFTPNLTPVEVIKLGSFGGTYFRDIESGVTGKRYTGEWKEFPFFRKVKGVEGLLALPWENYDKNLNDKE